MTDNIHTKWSPSSAERRILCPGSLAAEALHKDTDNISAVIGSGAHALGEAVLKQADITEMAFLAEDWLDEEMFVPMSHGRQTPVKFNDKQVRTVEGGYMVTVDQEMVHHIDDYVAHCKRYVMDKDFTGVYGVEVKLDLDKVLPGNSGTADWYAIVGNTIHVDDLKYGKGVLVEAKGNVQGRCYAIGVYLGLSKSEREDISEIAITVYQPRLGNVSTDVITRTDLLQWTKEVLKPAYAASQKIDAPRIPGDKQCTFCKHKAICPELREVIQHEVREGFPILDKTKKLPDTGIIPLQLAQLAGKWAKAVEAYAIEQLEAGEVVDDGEEKYKLVHGRGSRVWNNEQQAQKLLRRNKVFSKDFMTTPVFKSVAQVEKLTGVKQFKAFSDLVDKKLGKATLAKESDKRDAIGSAEALGFDDVTK